MVIALFGLALAMIAGGVWAVIQGNEIILLERGWAMVISGSVVATGGAALLGIAAAVRQLGRTRSELSRLRDRISRSEAPFPEPPRIDPMDAISAGLLAGRAGVPGRGLSDGTAGDPPRSGQELEAPADGFPEALKRPSRETRSPGAGEAFSRGLDWPASDQSHARTFGSEPVSGEFLPPALPVNWPSGSGGPGGAPATREADPAGARDRSAGASSSAHAWDAAPAEGSEATPKGRGREATHEPEKVAALREVVVGEAALAPDPNAEPAAKPMTVIGTYTSGANRYVMFSDGSIDAETPDGLFRFKSLDELKVFIAAGGEQPRQG